MFKKITYMYLKGVDVFIDQGCLRICFPQVFRLLQGNSRHGSPPRC